MSLNVVFAITGVAVGVAFVIVALVRSNKTGASVTAPSGGEKEKSFEYLGSKLVWNSLLVAVGIALVILGYYNPQIRPMDVGNVSWKYWHVVLTVWGIVASLIRLNACGTTAKTLQTVSAGVVVAVLVVFPLWGWTTSPVASSASAKVAPAVCPNVSAEETRECVVTSDWSSWIQFANGSRDNGKHMCASLGVQSERKDDHGVTFWRFRVADGTQEVKYKLLPADADCSGNVL